MKNATTTEQGETAVIGIPGMFWKLSKDGETVARADKRTTDGRWTLKRQGQPYSDMLPSVESEMMALEWIQAAVVLVVMGA